MKNRVRSKSQKSDNSAEKIAPARQASSRAQAVGSGRATAAALAILALAGIASYHNTFNSPQIFDGITYIQENLELQNLWPWTFSFGRNRPIGFFSFALNYAADGYRVWGYHAANLAIHVAAAGLLFGIVRRTLSRGRLAARYAAHAWGLVLAISLVWLVHPLATESVTYIYQRLESLMGLFYLATLWCFVVSLDSTRPGWWRAASVACCALGMGTKEVMVSAPLIVLWYDRAIVADSWREIVALRGRYYAALAATWGVLAALMFITRHEYGEAGLLVVPGLTPLSYALSQLGVILNYLRLSFWPDTLCLDYDWPIAAGVAHIVPQTLAIVALVLLTVWSIFRWPAWSFLGGWFFLILAPTSSIAPIKDLAFEHRMYLPLAAVVALVVIAGFNLWQYAVARLVPAGTTLPLDLRLAPAMALIGVATALGCRTVVRNADYRSEVAIWECTASERPGNARAHGNLAKALAGSNDLPRALEEFAEAIRLNPEYSDSYWMRAMVEVRGKDYAAAIDDYTKAIEVQTRSAEAATRSSGAFQRATYHLDRAKVDALLKHYDAAIADCNAAVELKPDLPYLLYERGVMQARFGRYDLAIQDFNRAIDLDRRYALAYTGRAEAYLRLRQPALALRDYDALVALQPRNAEVLCDRAHLQAQFGRLDAALNDFTRALSVKPDFAKATANRAVLYCAMGKFQLALADYDRTLELDPKYVSALSGRAWLRANCPDSRVYDPARALADATRACELTDRKDPVCLDTLAVAAAAQGDFKNAVKWETQALQQAPNRRAFQQAAGERLKLFRAGKPFRDMVPGY